MPVRNDDFVQDLRGKAFGKVFMGMCNGRPVFSQRSEGPDPASLSELTAYWVLQPNCGLPIKEGQPALGMDCTAVQLSAQRWHEHWQAFFDAMGRDQ